MPHRTYRTEAKLDPDSGKYRALVFCPATASAPIVESRAQFKTELDALKYANEIVQRAFNAPPKPEPAPN